MDKITEIIDAITGEVVILIDHNNGEFTSMLKSTYEAQLANEAKIK